MKDITLGQYYPVDSPIHRLDPRVKIIAAFLLIVLAFIAGTFIGYAAIALFLCGITLISKIPFSSLFQGMKSIYFLLLFTFVLNVFFFTGGEVLVHWWIFTITSQGLVRAVFMALRLLLLVTAATMLTLTTSPIALTDGIEKLLSPLQKIGFPAHEIAMMMTIALRFIPTLMEETDKIMKAQSARGAVFDRGGLWQRAKAIIPLLIPLFVSAFRRAEELAQAMEARCYHGGKGRTRLKVLKLGGADAVAVIVLLLFTGMILVDKILLTQLFPLLAGGV